MARTTKLELEQRLAAAQQEVVALRHEVSALRADNERLRGKPVAAERADWPAAPRAHKLPAHFAAAREAAMRLGRSVKVGTTETV